MTEHVGRDEAVHALEEIRNRQRQVVEASLIPGWYWAATGALMVVFSVGIESRRPVLIAIAVPVFAVGLTASILTVVLRARAQARSRYLGRPGAVAIAGFVLALLALAFAVGFGLAAAGFRWPATAGNLAAAIGMALGGPVLMRRLHTIMARRADETLRGVGR
jgi:hypothetical protein